MIKTARQLKDLIRNLSIEERCQTSVEAVKRKPGGYELKTSGGVVFAKRLKMCIRDSIKTSSTDIS